MCKYIYMTIAKIRLRLKLIKINVRFLVTSQRKQRRQTEALPVFPSLIRQLVVCLFSSCVDTEPSVEQTCHTLRHIPPYPAAETRLPSSDDVTGRGGALCVDDE